MVHEGQAKHVAEAIAGNRSNWDDRAEVHVRSEMYDVGGFLADRAAISRVVQNDLSSLSTHLPASGVRDRSLLHLQCHIGIDTISWARLGAVEVHGLDLSPNSLRHAARIAKADDREITWVEGDARFASTLIDRRFDTIVTSAGTIVWLPELATWAQSIHDLLEPGGVFQIRDDHPIPGAMAFEPWMITDDYLSGGGMRSYEDSATYTGNSDGQIAHTANHEWRHDLGEGHWFLAGCGSSYRISFGTSLHGLAGLPRTRSMRQRMDSAEPLSADPFELRHRRQAKSAK